MKIEYPNEQAYHLYNGVQSTEPSIFEALNNCGLLHVRTNSDNTFTFIDPRNPNIWATLQPVHLHQFIKELEQILDNSQ